MEQNIQIQNVMTYIDKKDGKPKTRVGFFLSDINQKADNKSYRGYSELSLFYDGDDIFKKITNDMIGKPLSAKLKTITNITNPMKSHQVIESFRYAGSVISFL